MLVYTGSLYKCNYTSIYRVMHAIFGVYFCVEVKNKIRLLPRRHCCPIYARRANPAAGALLNHVHVRLDLSIVHESCAVCHVCSTAEIRFMFEIIKNLFPE